MKKKLKIYLPFALNELKRQLAYKGAFYLFIFISLFGTFISYYLWMAIYGSSSSGTIGNLSQQEMIVYVFMVYVTSNVKRMLRNFAHKMAKLLITCEV